MFNTDGHTVNTTGCCRDLDRWLIYQHMVKAARFLAVMSINTCGFS